MRATAAAALLACILAACQGKEGPFPLSFATPRDASDVRTDQNADKTELSFVVTRPAGDRSALRDLEKQLEGSPFARCDADRGWQAVRSSDGAEQQQRYVSFYRTPRSETLVLLAITQSCKTAATCQQTVIASQTKFPLSGQERKDLIEKICKGTVAQ